MTDKKRRSQPPVSVVVTITEASIAERAYHRWLARGRPVGDGREDWFAAQAELFAQPNPADITVLATPAVPRARASAKAPKRKQPARESKVVTLPSLTGRAETLN